LRGNDLAKYCGGVLNGELTPICDEEVQNNAYSLHSHVAAWRPGGQEQRAKSKALGWPILAAKGYLQCAIPRKL
jgi:hypothetical protein